MAKTKEEKNVLNNTNNTDEIITNNTELNENSVNITNVPNQPSYEELANMVQMLMNKVQTLESTNSQVVATPIINTTLEEKEDVTGKLVELLANKKADKEVIIVHNCEVIGGASTHIQLSTLSIDFHRAGEERVLSWQQFEELVSKYSNFFNRRVILLGAGQEDIAARYGVPCVSGLKHLVTHEDLIKLGTFNTRQLSEYMDKLTNEDKKLVGAYWAGQCFQREAGYYDRAKVELLNNILPDHPFENILVIMNGDVRNQNLNENGGHINTITDKPVG